MPRILTICHRLEGIGGTTLTVQLAAAVPLCAPPLPLAQAQAAARGCPVAELDTDEARAVAAVVPGHPGQLAPGLAHL